MKTLLATVLLVFAGSLFAQSHNTPSGTPAEIKNDLLRVEREIGRANLDCDYRYFDQVEASDFICTDAAGGVTDKNQDMAGEKTATNPMAHMTWMTPRPSFTGIPLWSPVVSLQPTKTRKTS